jgi:hypothetical protein
VPESTTGCWIKRQYIWMSGGPWTTNLVVQGEAVSFNGVSCIFLPFHLHCFVMLSFLLM